MKFLNLLRTCCLSVLLITLSSQVSANILTDVGLGPVPAFDPDQGTEWTLSSSCIDINDNGEAACQTQAIGPTYGCGFRNAQNCSSKVKLVHKWDGNSLVMMSSPDAEYDVPLAMNNNGEIGGYAYVGEVYPSNGGNGRIWGIPGSPVTKDSIVRSLNDSGDYVLEWFDSPGGIAHYTSTAFRADGTVISYPGDFVRPFVISNNDDLIGAQILQTFVLDAHSPTGNEIPEVSGVGWLKDQQEVDAIPFNEAGIYDIDGDILYPVRFYRPVAFTDYETSVLDVNDFGEFVAQTRFGSYVSSRICSPIGQSKITDIFGVKHRVPWVCTSSDIENSTYIGAKVFHAVNNIGDAVGTFTSGTDNATYLWAWLKNDSNGWDEFNINDLLPPNSGYTMLSAVEINTDRQITGSCKNNTTEVVTGCILDLTDHPVPVRVAKPVVKITAPAKNSTVTGVVNIEATAWDRDGSVVRVIFKVDSTRIRADRTAPYNANLDTSLLTPGVHTIRAIAVDNDGNKKFTKIDVTVAAPDVPPTGDVVEGEGIITAVGTGHIEIDGVVTYYNDTTVITLNEVADFAVGLPVQYKGVLAADGTITASALEVN